MIVVGSIALLVLAAAVVLLYAMMGELASRLPRDAAPAEDPGHLTPLEDVPLGVTPDTWPEPLAPLAGRRDAAILVLSPICATCDKVAGQLVEHRRKHAGHGHAADDAPLAVVVSCRDAASGQEFLNRHPLAQAGVPCLVDEGGEWSTGTFGVNLSPTALVLETGTVAEAYSFGRLTNILDHLEERTRRPRIGATAPHRAPQPVHTPHAPEGAQ
ncbi:hypothetical protein [Yinghuangia seranimata]|uniref:hypothetical protein n=1 Tax=Yinghuangia seranimata TaxID=408067 RepID=UPI00248D3650|nr:hypothetical protein [Yinghuangia seranimata]MDI2131066.1 hypothetical protein [Yinghuangia seranimata]